MRDPFRIFQNIKHARRISGLSQKELADKLGVSDKTVSAYETGRAIPPSPALAKIAEITGVSISEMVKLNRNGFNSNSDETLKRLESVEERISNLEQAIIKLVKQK